MKLPTGSHYKSSSLASVFVLIAILAFAMWFLSSCHSVEPKQPEPMEPETIEQPTVTEPEAPGPQVETPDDVFNREWDACWAVYTDCQKTKSKDECFPAMETCGVLAYRKLKKARGV